MKNLNLTKKTSFTLAEGATGVKLLPTKAKGFTLAEVLITLGIIGVVAAMTIPTLIANTRSQQYRSQFKKTLSTLNQAALMSQAQYDFDFGGIDEFCNSDSEKNPLTSKSICSLFNGTLHGNWDTRDGSFYSGLYDGYDVDMTQYSSIGAIFQLSDGATVFASAGSPSAVHACTKDNPCEGAIDVNGADSKPNKVIKCQNADETEYLFEEGSVDSSSGFVIPASWKNSVCTVDNASMGDLFPVYFYDSTVVPATNAAAYVLNTAK